MKIIFIYSNEPKDNPKLGPTDFIFIGGVSLKALQNIFTDDVRKSFSTKLREDKKAKVGTETDDTPEDRSSILNIQEMQDAIFDYMENNQKLQMAHAAEISGNQHIAVSNRLLVTKR